MNHAPRQALNKSSFPRRREPGVVNELDSRLCGKDVSRHALNILRRTSLCLALFLMAGCSTSPKTNFYTLSASPQPLKTTSTTPYHVAIGPVSVPEMLDRPQIVTRTGPNQVTFNEVERWAEPLKKAIPRLIAEQLAELLAARISVYPQTSDDKDMSLNLTVLHFESQPGEAATVELQWTLRRTKDGVQREGHALVREAVSNSSYQAMVAAHTRALTRISAEIAESIQDTRDVVRTE